MKSVDELIDIGIEEEADLMETGELKSIDDLRIDIRGIRDRVVAMEEIGARLFADDARGFGGGFTAMGDIFESGGFEFVGDGVEMSIDIEAFFDGFGSEADIDEASIGAGLAVEEADPGLRCACAAGDFILIGEDEDLLSVDAELFKGEECVIELRSAETGESIIDEHGYATEAVCDEIGGGHTEGEEGEWFIGVLVNAMVGV